MIIEPRTRTDEHGKLQARTSATAEAFRLASKSCHGYYDRTAVCIPQCSSRHIGETDHSGWPQHAELLDSLSAAAATAWCAHRYRLWPMAHRRHRRTRPQSDTCAERSGAVHIPGRRHAPERFPVVRGGPHGDRALVVGRDQLVLGLGGSQLANR